MLAWPVSRRMVRARFRKVAMTRGPLLSRPPKQTKSKTPVKTLGGR
jgi:hypothetical protein